MNNFLKISISLLILLILISGYSATYTSLNIDNIAVVVAMSIDKNTNNTLKVSFQFVNPTAISESGPSDKSKPIIKTVSSSSISSAINLIDNFMGKEVTLSHCKLIVFSEELAKEGISDEIYTLINLIQVRPSTNIIIAKCPANYYIENSKPSLEPLLAKYYEIFLNSSQFTGFTTNATIGDFFDKMISPSCNPCAILGGINLNISNSKDKTNFTPNYTTLSSSLSSENIGLAVFKEGTMVGELSAIETLSYMCLKNSVNGFLISIPYSSIDSGYLDVYLSPTKKPKINVSLVNGSPYINIDYNFSGRIYSIDNNSNYLDSNILEAVSNSCNIYLENIFLDYLYKTAKDFHSDINCIGSNALKLFFTDSELEDFNWNTSYKNSFFNVSVNTNIKSASLLNKS